MEIFTWVSVAIAVVSTVIAIVSAVVYYKVKSKLIKTEESLEDRQGCVDAYTDLVGAYIDVNLRNTELSECVAELQDSLQEYKSPALTKGFGIVKGRESIKEGDFVTYDQIILPPVELDERARSKEFAMLINGRECGDETTLGENMLARDNGLIVVYGCSDDMMLVDGYIDDVIGVWEGGTVGIGTHDVDCEFGFFVGNEDDYPIRNVNGDTHVRDCIVAVYSTTGVAWEYRTNIPHETFDVMDGGTLYCKGIVIDIRDIISPDEEAILRGKNEA